jgi:hypothetical protein
MERDRTNERIETVKADLHDAADETKERTLATGERAKRTVAGDEMPLGDNLVSHAKELGHEMKANSDKAARTSRDAVEREP